MTDCPIIFSAIDQSRVDVENGIIRDVSVISEGEAKGHGLLIDSTTVAQLFNTARKHPHGVKVKVDHGTGMQTVIGVLKNFRVDGTKLRADLHLLRESGDFNRIIELAEKMPTEFGLSVAFSGVHERKGPEMFARCSELYSVDLVDQPAANPNGLFSEKPNKEIKVMPCDYKKFAKHVGLDADAKDEDIEKKLMAKFEAEADAEAKKKLEAEAEAEMGRKTMEAEAGARKMSAALESRIIKLESHINNATALAQKAEIDGLLAEASRDGKVIPLDTADIYEFKDGSLAIKTSPEILRKMITKLEKNQVKVGQTTTATLKVPEKEEERKTFYAGRRDQGALELSAIIIGQQKIN